MRYCGKSETKSRRVSQCRISADSPERRHICRQRVSNLLGIDFAAVDIEGERFHIFRFLCGIFERALCPLVTSG